MCHHDPQAETGEPHSLCAQRLYLSSSWQQEVQDELQQQNRKGKVHQVSSNKMGTLTSADV